MTIAIDCRMLDASGIGVYLNGCLPFFLSSENDFLLLGNRSRLSLFSNRSNLKIIECDIKPFSLKELFFFPKNISNRINQADVYYSPYFNIPYGIRIPVFTTIHDIIFPDMRELTSRLGLEARMYFYRRCFKNSKKIFTVSEFSRSRIEYYSKAKRPVIVTYSAIQPQLLDYRGRQKNIKKNKTIVFIGNIKKHKGLNCLFEAFLLAKNEGLSHKLIVIGGIDNFRTKDKAALMRLRSFSPEEVFFTGSVSNEQLFDYLSQAALLVQPSLYEGFCLPPLEALVLGTHVIISDIPVLKEIYEGFPVNYFQAGNAIDLKEKMMALLSQNLSQPQLSNDQLFKYTFEKTTKKILKELL